MNMLDFNSHLQWFQTKIGRYDQQNWEASVEQRILQGLENRPKRQGSLNKELIDIDLVSGSTFSKAKPRHGFKYVVVNGLKRVLLFPFYWRQWQLHFTKEIMLIFLLHYLIQIAQLIIYLLWNNSASNEMLLEEILLPLLLAICLGILHAHIIAPCNSKQRRKKSVIPSSNQQSHQQLPNSASSTAPSSSSLLNVSSINTVINPTTNKKIITNISSSGSTNISSCLNKQNQIINNRQVEQRVFFNEADGIESIEVVKSINGRNDTELRNDETELRQRKLHSNKKRSVLFQRTTNDDQASESVQTSTKFRKSSKLPKNENDDEEDDESDTSCSVKQYHSLQDSRVKCRKCRYYNDQDTERKDSSTSSTNEREKKMDYKSSPCIKADDRQSTEVIASEEPLVIPVTASSSTSARKKKKSDKVVKIASPSLSASANPIIAANGSTNTGIAGGSGSGNNAVVIQNNKKADKQDISQIPIAEEALKKFISAKNKIIPDPTPVSKKPSSSSPTTTTIIPGSTNDNTIIDISSNGMLAHSSLDVVGAPANFNNAPVPLCTTTSSGCLKKESKGHKESKRAHRNSCQYNHQFTVPNPNARSRNMSSLEPLTPEDLPLAMRYNKATETDELLPFVNMNNTISQFTIENNFKEIKTSEVDSSEYQQSQNSLPQSDSPVRNTHHQVTDKNTIFQVQTLHSPHSPSYQHSASQPQISCDSNNGIITHEDKFKSRIEVRKVSSADASPTQHRKESSSLVCSDVNSGSNTVNTVSPDDANNSEIPQFGSVESQHSKEDDEEKIRRNMELNEDTITKSNKKREMFKALFEYRAKEMEKEKEKTTNPAVKAIDSSELHTGSSCSCCSALSSSCCNVSRSSSNSRSSTDDEYNNRTTTNANTQLNSGVRISKSAAGELGGDNNPTRKRKSHAEHSYNQNHHKYRKKQHRHLCHHHKHLQEGCVKISDDSKKKNMLHVQSMSETECDRMNSDVNSSGASTSDGEDVDDKRSHNSSDIPNKISHIDEDISDHETIENIPLGSSETPTQSMREKQITPIINTAKYPSRGLVKNDRVENNDNLSDTLEQHQHDRNKASSIYMPADDHDGLMNAKHKKNPSSISGAKEDVIVSDEVDDPFVLWYKETHLSQHPVHSGGGINDAVSCYIWEHDELKKTNLSLLDIGWTIIQAVQRHEQHQSYSALGMFIAILLSFVPLIFRFYCNWAVFLTSLPTNLLNHHHQSNFSIWQLTVTDWSELMTAVTTSIFGSQDWSVRVVVGFGIVLRLILYLLTFLVLSVAEKSFEQRLQYAKNFCRLTSSRRARKYHLPHFRLNKLANIKCWLSLRSYLKKRGPQRSVDSIISAAFYMLLSLLSFTCFNLLRNTSGKFTRSLINWDLLLCSIALAAFMFRFLVLGTKVTKKYRNLSVLITEQINLFLAMQTRPHKKEELTLAHNVLRLAENLLKEVEGPFRVCGWSVNPLLYNILKVVILSVFSAVLSEALGFKIKLYKIKLNPANW